MQFLGLTIQRTKAADMVTHVAPSGWSGLIGSWFRVHEPFAGAWQRNISASSQDILSQSTVFACVTLIMQDIGKLGVQLLERNGKIWEPTENPAYSPVLREPNHYQNRIKFFESWVGSKLTSGNAYVLKVRNNRGSDGAGNVSEMHVLHPSRVQVLVAPDGDVFYALSSDNLAGIADNVTVPASEIIHDVGITLHGHPLCGLSPLVACSLAASQSLSIQQSSSKFFQNNSKPGGVLTAPNKISEDTAKRIREHWEANFAGEDNAGKVAVLGDGLKYEAMAMTAEQSQLSDQLKWTDEKICSVFHVPPFMVGVGSMPTYDNIAKLNQQYYKQALQELIECIELSLDKGLGLGSNLGVSFDLDGLLRMDESTLVETLENASGYLTPNEGRLRMNKPPVTGGDTVYRQQQDFSLEALSKRDAKADPFASEAPPQPAPDAPPADDADGDDVKGLFLKAAELQASQWYRSCPQL